MGVILEPWLDELLVCLEGSVSDAVGQTLYLEGIFLVKDLSSCGKSGSHEGGGIHGEFSKSSPTCFGFECLKKKRGPLGVITSKLWGIPQTCYIFIHIPIFFF